MSKKVMAAMSGGVDSTVVAVVLAEQGFTVTGATFCQFDTDTADTGLTDAHDARAAADALGIAHVVFDIGDVFFETEKIMIKSYAWSSVTPASVFQKRIKRDFITLLCNLMALSIENLTVQVLD